MAGNPVPAGRQTRVLGIDPGLRVCGWGVVEGGASPRFVAAGVIRPRTADSIAGRLLTLNQAVAGLIAQHVPGEIAIEDPFVGTIQPASALAIGQARAAAVLAGAAAGLEVAFYAPAAVKAAVSGYGRGDKAQVQAMVKLLLSLDVLPEPSDVADALAVAICHLGRRRLAPLTPDRAGTRLRRRSASRA
jgi:crossover junction endodeoxyribonuclease RuvC